MITIEGNEVNKIDLGDVPVYYVEKDDNTIWKTQRTTTVQVVDKSGKQVSLYGPSDVGTRLIFGFVGSAFGKFEESTSTFNAKSNSKTQSIQQDDYVSFITGNKNYSTWQVAITDEAKNTKLPNAMNTTITIANYQLNSVTKRDATFTLTVSKKGDTYLQSGFVSNGKEVNAIDIDISKEYEVDATGEVNGSIKWTITRKNVKFYGADVVDWTLTFNVGTAWAELDSDDSPTQKMEIETPLDKDGSFESPSLGLTIRIPAPWAKTVSTLYSTELVPTYFTYEGWLDINTNGATDYNDLKTASFTYKSTDLNNLISNLDAHRSWTLPL